MKCSRCATPKAENRWQPAVCADGRKVRSKWLCSPCDNELNRFVLAFFRYPDADQKMAAYVAKQGAP